ncbi:MAG: hypothetical protein D4S02_07140 [Rhodocyclaceae bacterium]|nr:MAG: hypothetical protein D4S02_07140 [Rhodocyclaceae bacterium]
MGATVTTGKLVGAFKAPDNTVHYVLYEQTFEKNCHPHTPRWSCGCIGTLEQSMQRIFQHAAACEGGMLQSRHGWLSPEGYLAGWMDELKAPAEMPDLALRLEVGRWLESPIPDGQLDEARQALVVAGREDLSNALAAKDEVVLSLHKDTAVIMALYGPGRISPWRIIRDGHVPTHRERNGLLGYAPARPLRFAVEVPKALRLDAENRLIQRLDGSWYCAGWEYSAVQDFICKLWEAELREPGSYRKRIKAYRAALKDSPAVPMPVRIVVDTRLAMDDWQRKQLARFKREYPVTETVFGFEADITEGNSYSATHLPAACTTWLIPQAAAAASEQLALLPA